MWCLTSSTLISLFRDTVCSKLNAWKYLKNSNWYEVPHYTLLYSFSEIQICFDQQPSHDSVIVIKYCYIWLHMPRIDSSVISLYLNCLQATFLNRLIPVINTCFFHITYSLGKGGESHLEKKITLKLWLSLHSLWALAVATYKSMVCHQI